jgi:hypothetical protein
MHKQATDKQTNQQTNKQNEKNKETSKQTRLAWPGCGVVPCTAWSPQV